MVLPVVELYSTIIIILKKLTWQVFIHLELISCKTYKNEVLKIGLVGGQEDVQHPDLYLRHTTKRTSCGCGYDGTKPIGTRPKSLGGVH